MKNKGITLITLTITVIVLLILVSVATYSGISVIRASKFSTFTVELKIMQTQVNNIYQKYKENNTIEIDGTTYTGEEILNIGDNTESTQSQANKVFTEKESGITSPEGYRYWSKNLIKKLGIEGVEQDFFIDLEKRSIVSYEGFNYEGTTYYTLEQIPDGLYNVGYENPNSGKPTFEVTRTKQGDNKWRIDISNIVYTDGYIDKWQVKYKTVGKDYWTTTEDLSFVTSTPGDYEIKIVNGDIESDIQTLNLTYVNPPKLVTGMKKIMFTEPTDTEKGKTVRDRDSGFKSKDWYEYTEQRWGNVETEDGSMWVWIPRFAYKITYTNPNDKSQGGKIDVKFLVETSDEYYDQDGNLQTAKRVTSKDEIADTTADYYIHPAFTNESSLDYANGGWDSELTGIWVAKFEAGYASSNGNTATVKASSQTYSQTTSWVSAIEAGTQIDSSQTARNWLDGIYGNTTGINTKISYPTFQGLTYSMNCINHNDAFNIAKVLNESGNIYGLNSSTTDSHLIKNSEWGAIAYLSQSQYGLNGTNIYINNISLNSGSHTRTATAGKSGVDSVYAVTGVTTGTENGETKIADIGNINNTIGNTPSTEGVYNWNQEKGQGASSTGTIYGIYDLSGGVWERTAGYVANGNANLKVYGASITYDGDTLKTSSSKYTTVYPHDASIDIPTLSSTDENLTKVSQANYPLNIKIFGDAIRETSTSGTGNTSWYSGHSYFPGVGNPFFIRGGNWGHGASAGLFYFHRPGGNSGFNVGFRAVLVVM